jgi:glycosyltransferase involved in cell wall biosynthesis
MKFSVVVPAYNEEKLLGEALRAIRAAMAVLPDAELIVCDNNSTDRTAEIARAAGARVVFVPVNQISRARNAGARAASGEWLIFVDADSYPSVDLFLQVKNLIESGRVLAGGVTICPDGMPRAARVAVRAWNVMSRALRWAAGAFIFVRADAFAAVGGFSEELYASEELDLSRKLKRRGRVVILHRHPLRTSDRKAHLYSPADYARFMLKTLLTGGRTLRSREDCATWYDGRR